MKIFQFSLPKSFVVFVGVIVFAVISCVVFLFVTAVFVRGYNPIQDGFFCDGAIPAQPAIYNYSKNWSVSQKEVICDGLTVHYIYLTKYDEGSNNKKLIFRFTDFFEMNNNNGLDTDNLISWIKWESNDTLRVKTIETNEITVQECSFENIRIKYGGRDIKCP